MKSTELPFDLVSLQADVVEELEDTYKALTEKFSISISAKDDFPIHQFDLLKSDFDIVVGGSLLINTPANNCHLVFLKINCSYYSVKGTVRTSYYRYQVWAFI